MEEIRRRRRVALVYALLTAALIAAAALNAAIGTTRIPAGDLARILLGRGSGGLEEDVVWLVRLPRLAMAAILGGALALSGFLLQTFFGNPIAGPFVLGISSGAKLTVALTMIFLLERLHSVSSWTLVGAAFLGSLLSAAVILLLSRRIRHMAGLLVAGIMIGYICTAVTDFFVTFADESDIVNLRGWSLGSFSGSGWDSVGVAAALTAAGLFFAIWLSKPMGAYQLGEGYARSMGVNVGAFRTALILLSSLLSACVTAFAGPISFVGIAVPHLVKRALNTARPLVVVPAVFLGGAVFCLACDLVARAAFLPTAFAHVELNISTVTAVFGAPVVIAMMLRRQKEA